VLHEPLFAIPALFDFVPMAFEEHLKRLTIKEPAGQRVTVVSQTLRVAHVPEPGFELTDCICKRHVESL
jgi:hypothetical protein